MTNRANPTDKAARLLDLVPFIYSHQGISLSDLAYEFSITQEQLLSDLNTLWMCGQSRFDLIELEFESGFVYIRNADVVNLVRSLSVQEVTSILFGLDILKESIPADRSDLLADIEMIRSQIGKPLQRSVVGQPRIPGEILSAIDASLRNRQKLKIAYHSMAEDVMNDRIIHPMERRIDNDVEFLLAFCEDADALRTFRVDRIRSAELLEAVVREQFIEKKEEQQSVEIKIHFDQRRVFESFGSLSPNADGSFTIAIYNRSWLFREVLAAAGAIEVLRPPELRAEVARQASSTLAQYR